MDVASLSNCNEVLHVFRVAKFCGGSKRLDSIFGPYFLCVGRAKVFSFLSTNLT